MKESKKVENKVTGKGEPPGPYPKPYFREGFWYCSACHKELSINLCDCQEGQSRETSQEKVQETPQARLDLRTLHCPSCGLHNLTQELSVQEPTQLKCPDCDWTGVLREANDGKFVAAPYLSKTRVNLVSSQPLPEPNSCPFCQNPLYAYSYTPGSQSFCDGQYVMCHCCSWQGYIESASDPCIIIPSRWDKTPSSSDTAAETPSLAELYTRVEALEAKLAAKLEAKPETKPPTDSDRARALQILTRLAEKFPDITLTKILGDAGRDGLVPNADPYYWTDEQFAYYLDKYEQYWSKRRS